MTFVFIKAGCYLMGEVFDYGESYEKPVYEEYIDDFWLAKNEVTQGQWE